MRDLEPATLEDLFGLDGVPRGQSGQAPMAYLLKVDSFELGRLTHHDFEALCRDLLGQVLGVPLEIFPPGADEGTDLRHTGAQGNSLIVQCKHWQRSGQARLISHMAREELPKIQRLNPDRYVLAVSTELNVAGKEKLRKALLPFVLTTGDIYGLDEIVEELRRRPEVVRRHFRLWLSSTAVLQTVLNQNVFLRSSRLRADLLREAATFVPHAGFERARETVEARRVCIITGMPGVGKTTVAGMLATWLAHKGYAVYEISHDIAEAYDVWQDDVLQMFLYDDFLGRTTLAPVLNKNEDNRLKSLFRQVATTPGKALVMTTRDYILETARQQHESLSEADIEGALSVVHLADLTSEVRAQILYNHVYYSEIPVPEKRAFADPDIWGPVLKHWNFIPRLIEETLRLHKGSGSAAVALVKNLDNPQRIWEHIVENQLASEAIHILEVLFTFGGSPFSVTGIQEAWCQYRCEMNLPDDMRTFRRGLKTLEGSMLVIDNEEVGFHNPSIQDYLRQHMNLGRTDLRALLRSLDGLLQVLQFLDTVRGHDAAGVLEQLRSYPDDVAAAISSAEETLEDSPLEGDYCLPLYLAWALGVGQDLESPGLARYVENRTSSMSLDWHHGSHLVELAVAMVEDSMVSRAHSADFTRRLAERLVSDIEEAAECDDWGLAYESFSFYRSLPVHDSFYTPSEELITCALRKLRNLADEVRFEMHQLKSIENLLAFLVEAKAQDDLPKQFTIMKGTLSAPIEHSKAVAFTRGADSGDRVESVPSEAPMLRRIGLLMDHLLQLQEPSQK